MTDRDKLIQAAFKASDALDNLKVEIEIAQTDRDTALKALKEELGIGPFVHPSDGNKYQIVQRHQAFYFREAK